MCLYVFHSWKNVINSIKLEDNVLSIYEHTFHLQNLSNLLLRKAMPLNFLWFLWESQVEWYNVGLSSTEIKISFKMINFSDICCQTFLNFRYYVFNKIIVCRSLYKPDFNQSVDYWFPICCRQYCDSLMFKSSFHFLGPNIISKRATRYPYPT